MAKFISNIQIYQYLNVSPKLILAVITFFMLITSNDCTNLIIAGGNLNDNNTEIYGTFFTLSNFSKDSFRIGIISAASDTPFETAKSYADMFESNYNISDII